MRYKQTEKIPYLTLVPLKHTKLTFSELINHI